MIIGLTGSLASGKGVVANFLKEKGFVYLSLSDELREIAKEQKVEINRENLQNLGNSMREKNGSGFLAELVVKKILNQEYKKAVVDGIRNPREIEVLRRIKDFFLVAVDAPREIRFQRMLERNRESDPKLWDDFVLVDNRDKGIGELETGQGVADCIKLSDFTLINSGELEEIKDKVKNLYEEIERKTPRPTWDEYFMSMAYLVASRSKDKSTHVGAVIVGPNNEIKSTGYNSFPRGLNDDIPERQEKPEKYFWFEHAERNAIYNATLIGTSLKGCKMYTNGIPCADCARAIIQSGIKEVVVDQVWDSQNQDIWKEQAEKSLQMFKETGVKVRYWEGKLLDIEKFRRGKVLNKN